MSMRFWQETQKVLQFELRLVPDPKLTNLRFATNTDTKNNAGFKHHRKLQQIRRLKSQR